MMRAVFDLQSIQFPRQVLSMVVLDKSAIRGFSSLLIIRIT